MLTKSDDIFLFKQRTEAARTSRVIAGDKSRRGIAVDIVYLVCTEAPSPDQRLYYLHAIRSGAPCLDDFKVRYEEVRSYVIGKIERGVKSIPFDSLLAVPTSRKELQDPYIQAIRDSRRSAVDLSCSLRCDRVIKSNEAVSLEDRIANLSWLPDTFTDRRHILLIDDIASRGRTTAPLIHSIRDAAEAKDDLAFTIVVPLWIVSDGPESWLRRAEA